MKENNKDVEEKMKQQKMNKFDNELQNLDNGKMQIYEVIDDPDLVKRMAAGIEGAKSVVIAKGEDGKPRAYADCGNGGYKEIEVRKIENDTKMVNKFIDDKQVQRGSGTTITLNDPLQTRLSINEDGTGNKDVDVLINADDEVNGDGRDEAFSPDNATLRENKRLMYEKYGTGSLAPDTDVILTIGEINARLADEPQEIRDVVGQEIETMTKNPTIKQYEELVEKAKTDYENQQEQDTQEQEQEKEDDGEKVPWDDDVIPGRRRV